MPKFLFNYYLFSFFCCFGPINGLYAVLMQALLSESTRATLTSIPAFLGALVCLAIDLLFGAVSSSLNYHACFVLSSLLFALLVLVSWFGYFRNFQRT